MTVVPMVKFRIQSCMACINYISFLIISGLTIIIIIYSTQNQAFKCYLVVFDNALYLIMNIGLKYNNYYTY